MSKAPFTEADARKTALQNCPGDVFGDGALCTEPCEGCIATAWDDFNAPPLKVSFCGSRLARGLHAKGDPRLEIKHARTPADYPHVDSPDCPCGPGLLLHHNPEEPSCG